MNFFVKRKIYAISMAVLLGAMNNLASADEQANFMLTGVQVNSITVCTAGCADGIANVTFTLADQVSQLCGNGSISFPLVAGSYGTQTEIPQAKMFLSMLVMSKINKQPLQVWFSNTVPDLPVTMPKVQKNCQGSLQHLGLD